MSSMLRRKEAYEIPPKDFLEEHERSNKQVVRQSGPVSQPVQVQQVVTPTPSAPALLQRQSTSLKNFEVLLQELRELGFDVRPLEVLKEYARKLEEEEKRLLAEIESRQRTLELVRRAREALRSLGA